MASYNSFTGSRSVLFISLLLVAGLLLTSCSGGGGKERRGGSDAANFGCSGDCPNQNLSVEDVTRVLRQAVAAASALGLPATIAVLDRPSYVLAVYQMPGANGSSVITSGTGAAGGLEGVSVPAAFCAISKAGTATNFSSQGNAIGTRTANQLLQEHFLPSEAVTASGPLFGVQFSQSLCSDINAKNPDLAFGLGIGGGFSARGLVGPRPLPLGFAADPGSIPLYKQGDLVGAIAVEADGVYSLDLDLRDEGDDSVEERIALSGAIGFEPPSDRVANVISVRGRSLRLAELRFEDLAPLPEPLPDLDPARLLTIPFFTNGSIRRGSVYGNPESGIARTARAGIEVEVLVNEAGGLRYPSRDGAALPGGVQLRANEVEGLLNASVLVAAKTRAQVRRPLDSAARVAVWIVDTEGNILGFVRSKDTILDSTDVTLQKARAAAFFSSPDAASTLRRAGLGGFVDQAEALLGPAVFNGTFAWSTTALGNISRPFFPDGVDGNPPGPLSLPVPGTAGSASTYSIFNLGIQLELYKVGFLPTLGSPPSVPSSCTSPVFGGRLRNGVQFFAGAFPLYRDGVLIGALSSSGDGTEQDDLIPFYAASRIGLDEAGLNGLGDVRWGFNAPAEIRADQIAVNFPQANLRYVVCPEAPFLGTNEQNVCADL